MPSPRNKKRKQKEDLVIVSKKIRFIKNENDKKKIVLTELPVSSTSVKINPSPRKTESNIKEEKPELCAYDDDNDQEDENDYELIRKKNIEDNVKFLSQIGVFEAKQQLNNLVKKPKREASQRGLKKKKIDAIPLVRRKSLRLARIDPQGNNLPNPIIEADTTNKQSFIPPECPVDMVKTLLDPEDKDYHTKMTCTMKSTIKCTKSELSSSLQSYLQEISKIFLDVKGIAKVVPTRIFSLAFHPITEKILVAAGGKWGGVGLWDVQSQENQDGVVAYKPHVSPVNWVSFHKDYPAYIYSSSYDGSFRYGDFETSKFYEIYAVPDDEKILLRNVDFITADTMLVSQTDGCVALVDKRTSRTKAESIYPVSDKALRTVSMHPNGNYFCTGSLDAAVKLWDLRRIKEKSNKCVSEVRHSRVVNSAYFSPVTGRHILSLSDDNTINIYDVNKNQEMTLRKGISHNNHTGRWLTKFRAVWHPSREDVFVVGSMVRPRRIEMFSNEGTLIKTFQNEDLLGSVCSINTIHPVYNILAGANSSGRVHVFK
ncbi:WD repeat-containing protein 76 [Patella vulgata]|uniref:WD repeat-containing protein 76 n=1 Tax=Patella vulgata TaxID=6465 RepID=UPI00217F7CEE|nr:WD repeat-containing protein 76 [Patella vulgata]